MAELKRHYVLLAIDLEDTGLRHPASWDWTELADEPYVKAYRLDMDAKLLLDQQSWLLEVEQHVVGLSFEDDPQGEAVMGLTNMLETLVDIYDQPPTIEDDPVEED